MVNTLAAIKAPIADELQQFEHHFRDSMRSHVPLLDKITYYIVQRKGKEWIVLGKTDIDEINQKIPIGIPDSKEYDTFSGYVLDKTGRIPQENEEILIDGFSITVKEVDGVRIKKYLVRQN